VNSLEPISAEPLRADRERRWTDMLPALCDVSVTNVCNAACDFCGFSRDKNLVGPRRYLSLSGFTRALPVLRRRNIRYLTFQGGEPLVHPHIELLVAEAANAGMICGVITNGWFLSRYIEGLVEAGLRRLTISIDSDDMQMHEANRGLPGLEGRIARSIQQAHALSIPVWASVTVNKLVDYEALPATLARLGFDAVCFSYPRRERFGSSSLVYDESSSLIDMGEDELVAAFEAIDRMRTSFPVLNPGASIAEVKRFVRGEEQRVPCVAGRKYFYLDWNLQIWRCEAWRAPLGSVFALDDIPDQNDVCNACMMACYRNASLMLHGPLAVVDAAQSAIRGKLRSAIDTLGRRGVAYSLWSLAAAELPRAALSSLSRAPAPRPPTEQAGDGQRGDHGLERS